MRKVTPPSLYERLERAANGGDARAWKDLLIWLWSPDRKDSPTPAGTEGDPEFAIDPNLLKGAIFGTAVVASFSKIKAILIVNTSTSSGNLLRVGGGSNPFTPPFVGSGTAQVEIGADSALLLSNKKDGWNVTAGTPSSWIAAASTRPPSAASRSAASRSRILTRVQPRTPIQRSIKPSAR